MWGTVTLARGTCQLSTGLGLPVVQVGSRTALCGIITDQWCMMEISPHNSKIHLKHLLMSLFPQFPDWYHWQQVSLECSSSTSCSYLWLSAASIASAHIPWSGIYFITVALHFVVPFLFAESIMQTFRTDQDLSSSTEYNSVETMFYLACLSCIFCPYAWLAADILWSSNQLVVSTLYLFITCIWLYHLFSNFLISSSENISDWQ